MAKKPATNTAPAAAPTTTAATTSRIAPVLTGVSNTVTMPEPITTRRGSKSPYPFDALTEVGSSFGIKNKTAKNMLSIVSNQNRKNRVQKIGADGNPIFKTSEMKDAEGNVTIVPTEKPEMVPTKKFFAVDCDPKTDPDGASVRVFRNL